MRNLGGTAETIMVFVLLIGQRPFLILKILNRKDE